MQDDLNTELLKVFNSDVCYSDLCCTSKNQAFKCVVLERPEGHTIGSTIQILDISDTFSRILYSDDIGILDRISDAIILMQGLHARFLYI